MAIGFMIESGWSCRRRSRIVVFHLFQVLYVVLLALHCVPALPSTHTIQVFRLLNGMLARSGGP